VACVGGSWMAPKAAVSQGDWHEVERLASAASRLKRS
jgi:2-dehydro-3-deoxyphosphogluconate aldolase / (4S)-4-hydroxy-2-oxoglutarate aldolase